MESKTWYPRQEAPGSGYHLATVIWFQLAIGPVKKSLGQLEGAGTPFSANQLARRFHQPIR